jgi:hypothetical protein
MCALPTQNITKLLNLHPCKIALEHKISDTDHEARLNVGNLYHHALEFFVLSWTTSYDISCAGKNEMSHFLYLSRKMRNIYVASCCLGRISYLTEESSLDYTTNHINIRF